jgi:meso-butanediol dehydrogenase/(S,S)-butanediol dehydrogenase/diacetyl reductase
VTVDRVAIVTGSGSGIGRGIASHLVKLGYKVAIQDLQAERVAETIALIDPQSKQTIGVIGDVSNQEDVTNCVNKVIAQWGRVDLLVNNAGFCQIKPIMEISRDEITRMFNVHVMGTFLFIQSCVPFMKQQKFGRIVNIVSALGSGASEFTSHYQAAKAAQHSMGKSAAISFTKYGITSNSVSPSTVESNLFYENDKNFLKYLGHSAKAELERRAASKNTEAVTTMDIARAVAFLAEPSSSQINGQVLGI